MPERRPQNEPKQRYQQTQRQRRPAEDTEFADEPGVFRHQQPQQKRQRDNQADEATDSEQ